jgi:UDP-3-O-[3-hydroxymyristoyl] glucosamine N-acyltransferase
LNLSDYFEEENIHTNNRFEDLGYSSHDGMMILTFCDSVHYLQLALKNDSVSVIIIKKELLGDIQETTKGICIDSNPRRKFFDIYTDMYQKKLFTIRDKYGRDQSSIISESAQISPKCHIGKNTIISENVVIKENVFIGDNCFIDAGAILGNDGMLYSIDDDENNIFIRHAGIVVVGNNATVLSNATIVKSVFPNMPTYIGENSIIGIATTIGHEARIGKNCKILGNSVIAKNAVIGDGTLVGSSSVIRENTKIGKGVSVKAGSIVIKDVKDGESVSGNFAYNHNIHLKNFIRAQR